MITQWRVTARHLSTSLYAKRKLEELKADVYPLGDTSAILVKESR